MNTHPMEDLSIHLNKAYVETANAFNETFPLLGDASVMSAVQILVQEAAHRLEHAKSLVDAEISRTGGV